jgi:hypothetical protein
VDDGVRRIVGRPVALAVVTGAGLASTPTAPTTATGVAARTVVVPVVLVGVVRLVTGLGLLALGVVAVGIRACFVVLFAPAPAPAATPAPAAFGRGASGLVVVGVRIGLVGVVVVGVVAVVVAVRGAVGILESDGLRSDEQREVVGGFHSRLRYGRFQDQPGLRLILDKNLGRHLGLRRRYDRGLRRGGSRILDRRHFGRGNVDGRFLRGRFCECLADAVGLLASHGGVRTARPAVELDEGVDDPLTGGPQDPGQRVNPHLLGRRGVLGLRGGVSD